MTDESPPPTPEAKPRKPRRQRPDKRTRERRLAVGVTTGMPEWSSARVLQALRSGADPDDLTGALAGLCLLADRAQAGDLAAQERALVSQAVALDAMFARLTELAMEQNYATNRALFFAGLRAQAACARTLEILNELKRPQPVTFIRQANVAAQQQVVNNAAPEALPDAAVTVLAGDRLAPARVQRRRRRRRRNPARCHLRRRTCSTRSRRSWEIAAGRRGCATPTACTVRAWEGRAKNERLHLDARTTPPEVGSDSPLEAVDQDARPGDTGRQGAVLHELYRAVHGPKRRFSVLPRTALESAESLEQLRALEHGWKIRVAMTPAEFPAGVDTEDDLARVEAVIQSGGRGRNGSE
ncbi:MAG: hypothetical protein U1F23_02415 [Lysobacterales bacterium]